MTEKLLKIKSAEYNCVFIYCIFQTMRHT